MLSISRQGVRNRPLWTRCSYDSIDDLSVFVKRLRDKNFPRPVCLFLWKDLITLRYEISTGILGPSLSLRLEYQLLTSCISDGRRGGNFYSWLIVVGSAACSSAATGHDYIQRDGDDDDKRPMGRWGEHKSSIAV